MTLQLKALQDEVAAMDMDLLRRLNARATMAIDEVLNKLAKKDIDPRSRETLRQVFIAGTISPLFNELLVMVLARGEPLSIRVEARSDSILGAHKSGEIRLATGTTGDPDEAHLRTMAYTLAHEFWHAAAKHYIYNQMFYFANGREFLSAIAGDELVAMAISLRTRSAVLRKTIGAEPFGTLVEYLNPMSFSGTPLLNASQTNREMRAGAIYDTVHQSHVKALEGWRDVESTSPTW